MTNLTYQTRRRASCQYKIYNSVARSNLRSPTIRSMYEYEWVYATLQAVRSNFSAGSRVRCGGAAPPVWQATRRNLCDAAPQCGGVWPGPTHCEVWPCSRSGRHTVCNNKPLLNSILGKNDIKMSINILYKEHQADYRVHLLSWVAGIS